MSMFDKFLDFEKGKEEESGNMLLIWRKKIFLSVFFCTLVVACIPTFLNIQIYITSGEVFSALTIFLSYVAAILVTFGKFIPFTVRAWIGLLLFYSIGVLSLFTVGAVGSGRMLLFVFATLATLILGLRAGIMALTLNLLTMILWIWACFNNDSHLSVVEPFSPTKILASGFTFLFTNSVVTISLGIFVRVLEKGFKKEQDLSDALKRSNEELLKENEERKRAQDTLKESERKYRLVADNVNDMIWLMDIRHRRFSYISPSVERMRGYTPAEVMEQSLEEILTPASYEKAVKTLSRELAEDKGKDPDRSVSMELEQYRKDGSTMWTEIAASVVRDDDGRPIAVLGVTRDISERKKTEAALLESEAKFRLISEQSLLAIGIIQDGYITYANEMYSRITGYTLDEIYGWEPFGYARTIHKEDLSFVLMQSRKKQAGQEDVVTNYQFRGFTKEKRIVWWEIYSKSVTYHGRPADLFTLIDITERIRSESDRKALEKQLQNAQKMEAIGTLAGGIAHDFNNQLMGMQGRTSLMLMNKDASHPDFEHLTAIDTHIASASELTRQLLGFARGGKYEIKPTDLNRLIVEENRTFGRTRKDINIHGTYEENLRPVEVDRGQIQQTLLNLYVNAWHAMPGGGDLHVKTQNVTLDSDHTKAYDAVPGNYVQISVTDTGIGMDKATQERVFDPFFTTKEVGRGTGLGLASAYGIVRNHGGFIHVYSKKGHGTTFTVYLPASEKEVREEKERNVNILKGSERVLFVDDEETALEIAREFLEQLGYEAITAGSGKEAIRIYEENSERIDLVVLDMIMPDMGGGDTFDALKKVNPEVKVLLSSGYSIDGQATEILNRGCRGFIQKPFRIKEFSQKLREILDEKNGYP